MVVKDLRWLRLHSAWGLFGQKLQPFSAWAFYNLLFSGFLDICHHWAYRHTMTSVRTYMCFTLTAKGQRSWLLATAAFAALGAIPTRNAAWLVWVSMLGTRYDLKHASCRNAGTAIIPISSPPPTAVILISHKCASISMLNWNHAKSLSKGNLICNSGRQPGIRAL